MSAKKQTFEQEIARLEEIVAALEKGDAPLADSLEMCIRDRYTTYSVYASVNFL